MLSDSLDDAKAIYLDWHRAQRHSLRTVKVADYRLGRFIEWLRSHRVHDVAAITPALCWSYQGSLAGLRAWSARTIMGTVKGWLNWCALPEHEGGGGLLKESPSKGKLPKAEKLEKPFLSKGDFEKIERQAKKDGGMLGARRVLLIWLLLTTGLRAFEMAGIQLAQIDRVRKMIRVLGKGAKERDVPFRPEAHRAFVAYMQHRRDKLPGLWITEERRAMTAYGLGIDLRRLMDSAGVKAKDRWHIWRRTWAANAGRSGAPTQHILGVAGWEDEAMLSRYTKAMRREDEAVDSLRGVEPFQAGRGASVRL